LMAGKKGKECRKKEEAHLLEGNVTFVAGEENPEARLFRKDSPPRTGEGGELPLHKEGDEGTFLALQKGIEASATPKRKDVGPCGKKRQQAPFA